MAEDTKSNNSLKLILGVARYILGALILVSGPLTLLLYGKDPTVMVHAIVNPVLAFFADPQIVIGFYFMLTKKWRTRLDLTLFLVALALIFAFSAFASGFNT